MWFSKQRLFLYTWHFYWNTVQWLQQLDMVRFHLQDFFFFNTLAWESDKRIRRFNGDILIICWYDKHDNYLKVNMHNYTGLHSYLHVHDHFFGYEELISLKDSVVITDIKNLIKLDFSLMTFKSRWTDEGQEHENNV